MTNAVLAMLFLSPFIGSFAGVLVLRLPMRRPVAIARSRCDGCATALAPWDLVPLISYGVLQARCRHCGGRIGWFYPAIELAALAVASCAAAVSPPDLVVVNCLFGWTLLTLAWIDIRTTLLPDCLTLPLLAGGVAQSVLYRPGLGDALIGAAAGYGVIWLIAAAYRRWRGRDGIGLGDAKLLACAGAWLGWQALPSIVLAASAGALAVIGAGALLGRPARHDGAIAFGPFLAASMWAARLLVPDFAGGG